ncbi:MAG: hypothetical protein ACXVPM_19710 [Bacteroidia bacterium]
MVQKEKKNKEIGAIELVIVLVVLFFIFTYVLPHLFDWGHQLPHQ